MASTYAGLQTEIADLLHRTDLTSKIPSFITRAEARLNRVSQLRTAETESTLTCVVDSRFIALPSTFTKPIALWIEIDTERNKLESRIPSDLNYSETSGEPEEWAIDGTNIAFDKPADDTYTIYFRHFTKFALSDTVTTNWLLTENPDIYLYAALMESAPYIRDDGRLATWKAMFDMALQELKDSENKNKSIVKLRTEIMTSRSQNILTGE